MIHMQKMQGWGMKLLVNKVHIKGMEVLYTGLHKQEPRMCGYVSHMQSSLYISSSGMADDCYLCRDGFMCEMYSHTLWFISLQYVNFVSQQLHPPSLVYLSASVVLVTCFNFIISIIKYSVFYRLFSFQFQFQLQYSSSACLSLVLVRYT